MHRNNRRRGFALYEVLLGLTIFVIGVLTLGRAVQNCITASQLATEEARVRQLLANRMAEIQSSPIKPDSSRETKIDTGYGTVRLIEKATPEDLEEADNTIIGGITRVMLDAEWTRGGVQQSKRLVFYVYRAG